MLESGLESWLGLEFAGFSRWHFLKLVVRGFLRVLRCPPLLHQLIILVNKLNVSTLSNLKSGAVPLYQMAHDMLHV